MSRIVVQNIDVGRITPVSLDGPGADDQTAPMCLLEAQPPFFWIALAGSVTTDLATSFDISPKNIVASTPNSLLLAPTQPMKLEAAVNFGSSDATDAFLYAGTLPDKLITIVEEAHAERKDYATLINAILADVVRTKASDETDWRDTPIVNQSRHSLLDIYRGCAEMARKLQKFDKEALLLQRANEVKPSKYVAIALSKALSRAQRYRESRAVADQLALDHPGFIEDGYPEHLAELDAFEAVTDELKAIGARPNDSAKRNRHVAYCLHNSLPYSQGGYAERSHGLAKAVADTRTAITPFMRPGFPTDSRHEGLLADDTVEIDGLTYHFENGFGRRGRAYGYIAEAADYYQDVFSAHEISIVHAATNFWTALPAAIAAYRLGLPFLYEVRSFWRITREAREPGFSESAQAFRDEALETLVLALSDQVITLNGAMADYLSNYGVGRDRITLVPNSVDDSRFIASSGTSSLAESHGIERGDIVIGYLGAMLYYEGLDLLVEAAAPLLKQYPNVKLLIVGGDISAIGNRKSIEGQLQNLIDANEIGGSAKIIGRVEREEISEYYGLYDICAYPRRALQVCELVSPLKPLEAMAAGKAVIVSNVGGMSDMVAHEQTGLQFAAGNIDDLRAKLSRLITDERLRKLLGGNAQAFASNNRTWENAVSQLATVYDNLEKRQKVRSADEIADAVAAPLRALLK